MNDKNLLLLANMLLGIMATGITGNQLYLFLSVQTGIVAVFLDRSEIKIKFNVNGKPVERD
jgi:hypothetical protein